MIVRAPQAERWPWGGRGRAALSSEPTRMRRAGERPQSVLKGRRHFRVNYQHAEIVLYRVGSAFNA